MAVVFKNLADALVATPDYLVQAYNDMIDATMVQPTSPDEMTQICKGSFAAMHRLNKLEGLDDDGNTFDDITIDMQTDFNDVMAHQIVLLVNNGRQTQFFQKDDNGKDIAEFKINPLGNGNPMVDQPTNTAQVAYNLFDINLKADKNLQQVSEVLKEIYHEYRQYLKGVVSR